jgi:large subunit ribosomal protein L35
MKTNKSVKARFKVTAKKKLKRTRPGRRHLLEKKSANRKRKLRKKTLVSKTQTRTYSRLLGIA